MRRYRRTFNYRIPRSEWEFYHWNAFYDSFFSPLKKCTICGIEAYSEKDLDVFMISNHNKHKRANRCMACQKKAVAERMRERRKNNSFWAKFQAMSSRSRKGVKANKHWGKLKWKYLETLAESQNYRCALTGIALKRNNINGKRHYNAPSMDRIDNSRGYEVGNVRWTSQWANLARSDYGDEVFYKMCKIAAQFVESVK